MKEARKLAFKMVPETCPEIERAFQDAEDYLDVDLFHVQSVCLDARNKLSDALIKTIEENQKLKSRIK